MRKVIKYLLPSQSKVYRFLSRQYRYFFVLLKPPVTDINGVLSKFNAQNHDIHFIQVGSNDGISNDPIHHYIINHGWKGILIEPVQSLFQRLKATYIRHCSQLIFENAAVAPKDGMATFYRINEREWEGRPFWYSQIGSFNKEVLLSHKDCDEFESLIVEDIVPTVSFETLLKKNHITNVDLIHIDTEGYDFEILKLIDWSTMKIKIVIYEYVHLSLFDFVRSMYLMKSFGFKLFSSGLDIVCVHKSLSI